MRHQLTWPSIHKNWLEGVLTLKTVCSNVLTAIGGDKNSWQSVATTYPFSMIWAGAYSAQRPRTSHSVIRFEFMYLLNISIQRLQKRKICYALPQSASPYPLVDHWLFLLIPSCVTDPREPGETILRNIITKRTINWTLLKSLDFRWSLRLYETKHNSHSLSQQDEKDKEKMAVKLRAQKEQEEKRMPEEADWKESRGENENAPRRDGTGAKGWTRERSDGRGIRQSCQVRWMAKRTILLSTL